MTDDSLTHADLAQAAGVSVTTIKSYRSAFPAFLPLRTHGKPLRFAPEAATACRIIRQGFAHGLSPREIETELARALAPAPAPEPAPAPLPKPAQPTGIADVPAPASAAAERLEQALAALLQEQRASAARLERLEQALARAAAPAPGLPASPDPGPGAGPERIIRIRTAAGTHQRFRLTPLGPDPGEGANAQSLAGEIPDNGAAPPPGPETPAAPPDLLLDQPLVILSPRGEYLGIAGGANGHFCVRDYLAVMARKLGAGQALPAQWSHEDPAWTLSLPQDAGPFRQEQVLRLEPAATPRGNQVTLLRSLRLGPREAPPAFLQAFLRQLGKESAA